MDWTLGTLLFTYFTGTKVQILTQKALLDMDWPLGTLLFTTEIMRKYNELFSFLLRVKRAKTELQQVHTQFTCFSSTKVQILKHLRRCVPGVAADTERAERARSQQHAQKGLRCSVYLLYSLLQLCCSSVAALLQLYRSTVASR